MTTERTAYLVADLVQCGAGGVGKWGLGPFEHYWRGTAVVHDIQKARQWARPNGDASVIYELPADQADALFQERVDTINMPYGSVRAS